MVRTGYRESGDPLSQAYFTKHKFARLCLCTFLILGGALYSLELGDASAAPSAGESTLILYDAAAGTLPGLPQLGFTDFPPGAAPPTYSDGAAILDTTSAGRDTYAGWTFYGATTPGSPILDRTAGFRVDFTLQMEAESHRKTDRSGFSLIVLSNDARGIELAFWENQIWVQGDDNTGGLFKHGEGVTFATTTSLVEYQLSISGDSYTLTADSQPILSGAVRDYSSFDGFPDPYETPNFLFLGDNTTSAQARTRLSFVSITGTEPVVPTSTSTSTSTSSPPATVSRTPDPTTTPIPAPTPTGGGSEFCPSSAILLAGMIPITILLKRVRAKFGTTPGKTGLDQHRLLYPARSQITLFKRVGRRNL